MKHLNKDQNKTIQNQTVLFVDGYNVINAWPDLKRMLDDDFEGARERLNDYMFEYASFYGETVYVVYDAYQQKNKQVNIEKIHDVYIVYTKTNQTADTYIEKKVKQLGEDLRLTVKVVTSDWVQQRQILGSGGFRLTPYELKEKCLNIKVRIQRKAEKHSLPQGMKTSSLSQLKSLLKEKENIK